MRSDGTLPPWVAQVVGLGTFVFFCGFWAVTDRVASELLAASGTFYSVGLVQDAKQLLLGRSKNQQREENT